MIIMARRTAAAAQLEPGRRPDIEQELSDTYGVKWEFIAGVNLSRFDLETSKRNQARFEALDPKTVETYREAVERGDAFPAVIAYPGKDGKFILIDGNHRANAHAAAGRAIDVYSIVGDPDPRTIAVMTFAFNTKHGRPTSEAERITQATYLVDNGATLDAAATAVNLAPRILKLALAKNAGDKRADEVGLRRNEWDTLSGSVKNRLNAITTDEGFAAAARLAFSARLLANEVFDLVSLTTATRSGVKQVEIIENARQMYAERVQATAGGVLGTNHRGKVSAKGRLGLGLGQLLAIPDDDAALVRAYAPAERPEAAKRVRTVAERLARLADLMESGSER